MARSILLPMPRRHPLPPPARPALLERLDARLLEGADAAALERELTAEPALAAEVAALRALGLPASSARELRDVALAAALRLALRDAGERGAHDAARQAARALLAARLAARVAQRSARAPGLAPGELACLPLVRALAGARLEGLTGDRDAVAREAAATARTWGLSGAAVEALASAGDSLEQQVLALAERLANGPDGACGELARVGLERAGRALGLRPAELAELGDFAAAARATSAA